VVTITDLSKEFGGRTLFRDVSMQLHAGNRYGIVGANGSGKSTFLRILTDEDPSSGGSVQIPKATRVGVLEQDHYKYEDVPILHVVMMGHTEVWSAMTRKEAMLSGPEEDFDADRYANVEETILRLGGYALESRAAEILEGMGISTAQHYDPLSTLSGGYKLRVLLARTLAGDPDLLLLDEPNNHLDILSLRWLETFLCRFAGCAVVVSHDHRFLDNMTTHILDVDYEQISTYRGNYSAFLAAKVEHRGRQEREIAKREKEISDHKAFIARFKAKATKARQANSRQKRMEKIEIAVLPQSSRRHPKFAFPQKRPSGRTVLEAVGISKRYGDNQVLDGIDLQVDRGDRIAVIGPNGIGKSTLLKILQGEVEADEGLVEWGYETHRGYFAQDHGDVLQGDHTVASWLWDQVPLDPQGAIYGRLATVLFSRDDADKRLTALSGGEAARLVLCGVTANKPNVLILDEPTNHLDLEGIESLAASLKKVEGTLLLVSHDRWFVAQVATRILEIRPDGVEDFRGTYAEYLSHLGTDHLDRNEVVSAAKEEKKRRKGRKK
jgi:ATPase subunit of ABC transporter with duplicated ATPase domains